MTTHKMNNNTQWADALGQANGTRVAIKEIKQGIAKGELDPVDVILHSDVPIKAFDVLRSIRSVGSVKAEMTLRRIGLNERHTLGGRRRDGRLPMTDDQRMRLAQATGWRVQGHRRWEVAA